MSLPEQFEMSDVEDLYNELINAGADEVAEDIEAILDAHDHVINLTERDTATIREAADHLYQVADSVIAVAINPDELSDEAREQFEDEIADLITSKSGFCHTKFTYTIEVVATVDG